MPRTYVILDGIDDPKVGLQLSRAWTQAGFANAVDVSGQCGWLAWQGDEARLLGEDDVDRAAAIARGFGLELRDRVGTEFKPDNDLAALRGRLQYEYKSRFATAIVFGLPALVLHALAPWLSGGATQARQMLYPWLFELLLVGWACLAGGWPVLWQGALSLRGLRMTGDLFVSLVLLVCFLPSAVGVAGLPLVRQTFLSVQSGPLFHAAMIALTLTLLQRWMLHSFAGEIAGRADTVMRGGSRLLFCWLLFSVGAGWWGGAHLGAAVALLMPGTIALGGVNPWNPGPGAALPVVGFAVFLLLGPGSLGRSIAGLEIWIAGGFGLIMTLTQAAGWRRGLHRA